MVKMETRNYVVGYGARSVAPANLDMLSASRRAQAALSDPPVNIQRV